MMVDSIPTINIVAVAHLYFIAVFLGVYASEAVMELYSYFAKEGDKTLHATAIYHYWIDNFVEIPTLIGIAATGIAMAFLVEKLTVLHWVLIGCVICMIPGTLNCILTVRKRYKALDQNADRDTLRKHSRIIMLGTSLTVNPFLLAVILIGFWLAYNRVLDSIYG